LQQVLKDVTLNTCIELQRLQASHPCRSLSSTVGQARASLKANLAVVAEYLRDDTKTAATSAVYDAWCQWLRCRLTKLECLFVRSFGKLSGKKLVKTLQNQQGAFVADTKSSHEARDPASVVWAPLWALVAEKLK
jgi:hypothetical protein